MTTTSSPPGPLPAGSPPSEEDAAAIMADLTRPLARIAGSNLGGVVQVVCAALMTAAGAGLRLAGAPGIVAVVVSVSCAVLVSVRITAPVVIRSLPSFHREPPWVPAARVLQELLPDRVPAGTLAVVRKYLPMIGARRQAEQFVYVAPCPGTGAHSVLCRSAAIWQPSGRVVVILGEHPAADPAVTAACLSHEAGHVTGWTYRAFMVVHGARRAGGWGWAAAGFAGSAWGWPGVLAAAAIFWAVSMLAAWGIEIACDRRAVRAEGQAAIAAGFAYMAAAMAADRSPSAARRRIALALVLGWLAGPPHPPMPLRRRLATAWKPAGQ